MRAIIGNFEKFVNKKRQKPDREEGRKFSNLNIPPFLTVGLLPE